MTSRKSIGTACALVAMVSSLVVIPTPAAAAPVAGRVAVAGGVTMRKGASTKTAAAGHLRNGARMTIRCAVSGQTVKGSVRRSRAWARLANGAYVSMANVRYSTWPRTCAKSVSGRAVRVYAGAVVSADGGVRLRTGPSTRFPIVASVLNRTKLRLTCAATGERITGTRGTTTQWDKLADGRWISHAYVSAGRLPRCASVPKPPAVLTNAQFIKLAGPGAQRGWREYGVPPSVTIGQAILESGWGRSALAAVHHNYFGIKCNGKGPLASGCYSYQTFECSSNGNCFDMSDSFRTYRAPANSFRDHGLFLRSNSRYKGAFTYTRSSNQFLYRIWKAGYATDPQYYAKVTALMKSHNLYKYDTWR
ncbi:hypothetical protein GCM10010123_35310 [Pilimelia anulata]|uniref:Uncharacterized protein n=1 Tax=Pilimelia anulata TaxID=53371 RepID=A0A8J3BGN0_9ACTN|nr:sporangiospore maturation cell wall hydrolase GsmA [Pilimelia anulata]GGK02266.1 hypothetical protein GCM10010123_35310 [Pilimelia anulata]